MSHYQSNPFAFINSYFIGFILNSFIYNLRPINATNSCAFLYSKGFQRYSKNMTYKFLIFTVKLNIGEAMMNYEQKTLMVIV
jgi:hypothetical protein